MAIRLNKTGRTVRKIALASLALPIFYLGARGLSNKNPEPVPEVYQEVESDFVKVCGESGFGETAEDAARRISEQYNLDFDFVDNELFNQSRINYDEVVNLRGDTREFCILVHESMLEEAVSRASGISHVFTEEVQYWNDDIMKWSEQYGLDPNLIATIMQIESCGYQRAGSGAGARGLFQVMPFHFGADEDHFDPDVNARRGIAYLARALELANGDISQSAAGYNGGHSVIGHPERWYQETQDYVYWASGIYNDAISGRTESPTLQEWLNAGGQSLCNKAHNEQH